VVTLWVWALRRFLGLRCSDVGLGAFGLIVLEALVGAGLVLLEWVGENASTAGPSASSSIWDHFRFAGQSVVDGVEWGKGARPGDPGRSNGDCGGSAFGVDRRRDVGGPDGSRRYTLSA
jgi:hypothetical protein